MNNRRYLDRLDLLFPNCKQMNDPSAIRYRVNSYFKPKDKEEEAEVYEFISKVMNHSDYKNIKVKLATFSLEEFRKYKKVIMQVLSDSNYDEKILQFLNDLSSTLRISNQLISRFFRVNIICDLQEQEKKDILYTISLQGYDLLNGPENSMYMMALLDQYDKLTAEAKTNPYLKTVVDNERPTLYERCLKAYRNNIRNYDANMEKANNLTMYSYTIEGKNRYFKRMKQGKVSCSHPR